MKIGCLAYIEAQHHEAQEVASESHAEAADQPERVGHQRPHRPGGAFKGCPDEQRRDRCDRETHAQHQHDTICDLFGQRVGEGVSGHAYRLGLVSGFPVGAAATAVSEQAAETRWPTVKGA